MRYASNKATTPEGAEKLFKSYQEKYPGTEKTVDDFFEAPKSQKPGDKKPKAPGDKKPKAPGDKKPKAPGDKPKARQQTQELTKKFKQAPPEASQKIKKSMGKNLKALKKVKSQNLSFGKKAVLGTAKLIGKNLGAAVSGSLSLTGGAPDGAGSLLGLAIAGQGGGGKGEAYGKDIGEALIGKGSGTKTLKKDWDTIANYFHPTDSKASRQKRVKKLEKRNSSLSKKLNKASPKKAAKIKQEMGKNLGYLKNLKKDRTLGEAALMSASKRAGQAIGSSVGFLLETPALVASSVTGPSAIVGAALSAMSTSEKGGRYGEDVGRWLLGEGGIAETAKKDVSDAKKAATESLETIERVIQQTEEKLDKLGAEGDEFQDAVFSLITYLLDHRPDLIANITDEEGNFDEGAFDTYLKPLFQGKIPAEAPAEEVSEEQVEQATMNLMTHLLENRQDLIEEVVDEDGNFDEGAFETISDKLLKPEKKASLRARLIRTAFTKKELRPLLLPLLWKD